ncbi:MAG: SAM-dependent methyltransferase, partial [Thiohalophilus sp.]
MNTADSNSTGTAGPLPQRLRYSQAQLADWPLPGQLAQEHSLRLIERIHEKINAAGGSISFHDYMQACLYEPGLGYYSAGASKFGAEGDFITAPEISPLFAGCLARSLAPVLQQDNGQVVLEAGAGSGILAARLLTHWQELDCLPLHYYILELSADLRARQRQQLAEHCPQQLERVIWLDEWPNNFEGVVLANELLDAMPVHRVHKRNGLWHEQRVTVEQEQFVFQERELQDSALRQRLEAIEQDQSLPDDYLTEVNLNAEQWIKTLGEHLHQGVVLLLDYGYPRHEFYHPQRDRGTLMCHYRHRAHDDTFVYPGLQDITAHIDFTAVADAAQQSGFEVAGYTTQAHYLLDNGLMQQLEQFQDLDESQYQHYVSEVRR